MDELSAVPESRNVQTVRRSLEAINADDFEGVMECFTDDCVFDGSRIAEGIYEGKDNYRAFLEESKRLNSYRFSGYSLLEGDELVVALVDASATGTASGASTLGRLGFLYRMRDDLIARQEIHPDPGELLAGLGLGA